MIAHVPGEKFFHLLLDAGGIRQPDRIVILRRRPRQDHAHRIVAAQVAQDICEMRRIEEFGTRVDILLENPRHGRQLRNGFKAHDLLIERLDKFLLPLGTPEVPELRTAVPQILFGLAAIRC